jgi:MFS family permease
MTAAAEPAVRAERPAAMTHREVLEAMSGLLLGMFVTILSSTVVSAALPRIITDLHGGQSSFTWVVTSTLLALTVSTPIWGKLADLVDRKLLVQVALSIYVVGSIFAGLSQSTGVLIAFRVLQGLGAGGMTALTQVVLSDLVPASAGAGASTSASRSRSPRWSRCRRRCISRAVAARPRSTGPAWCSSRAASRRC